MGQSAIDEKGMHSIRSAMNKNSMKSNRANSLKREGKSVMAHRKDALLTEYGTQPDIKSISRIRQMKESGDPTDYKQISKEINKHLDSIKDTLKAEDKQRSGVLSEQQMNKVFGKYRINVGNLEKFRKGRDIDYIKFLKFYI